MKKIPEIFWATFGGVVLFSVLLAQAWWHLFTVIICIAMYVTCRAERKTEEE